MEKLLELKEFILEKKYYVIGGIILLLIIISICFYFYKLNDNDIEDVVMLDKTEELKKQEEIEDIKEKECYVNVDIKGEVNNPGLYKIECESRVNDVINKAGGITENGDTSILNLGKKVNDEMVIIVYSKTQLQKIEVIKEEIIEKIEKCECETEIKNDACISKDDLDNVISNDTNNEIITDTPVMVLVSINKASKEELMTLSGIGESKANNIINYRNENNGFKTLEEIKNVKGIGDSIFEKIKDSITL